MKKIAFLLMLLFSFAGFAQDDIYYVPTKAKKVLVVKSSDECYFVDDSANYSSANQTKEIKQGVSLDVEIAYELNDTTTDIEVEISELFSFSDRKIQKTFSIK